MSLPFQTTSWSLISRARESGEAAHEATGALCRIYWQPLYVYARRVGQSAHAAEDTVQGFLVHVLKHDIFARADATRGRFRSFLVTALRQFIANEHRHAARLKRAMPSPTVSFDFESGERLLAQSPLADSPEDAFDRAWALAQLELTWQRIESEFSASDKSLLYKHLRALVGGSANAPAREIAMSLGMSEGALNVAAHRLRRQFGEYLREQVAQTLALPEEIEDEIEHLRAALA